MFPILFFAVSMLLSMLTNGYTATYYVAKTGSDSNSCAKAQNQSTPKFTVAQGISCLVSGDTLIIKGGTYANTTIRGVPSGGGESTRTVVKGAAGETVTLLVPAGASGIDFDTESYISVENMILDGQNKVAGVGIGLGNNLSTEHHIRVKDVEVRQFSVNGASVFNAQPSGPTRGYHEFINVSVHDNGSCCYGVDTHGFYVTSSNSLWDNVTVYNQTQGYGIHIYLVGATIKNNVIRNSRFYGNQMGGVIILFSDGTIVENSVFYQGFGGLNVSGPNRNVTLRNNTVYGQTGPSGYGISITNNPGPGPFSILNNLVYGNSQRGIYIENAPGVTVSNNLSSGNAGGNFVDVSSQATLSNNLFGSSFNPKFVNPGAQDFHLQAGSAAIDVGMTIGALTTDKDGTTRPQGSQYDIGAYEYRTSTLSPPAHFRLIDMSK